MINLINRLISKSQKILTNSYRANIFILSVFLVRTGYGLFIIDPHSGQDAPSYFEDAEIVLREGPFAQVSYAPIWPIGYTWFMASIWKIGGLDSRLLGVVQSSLVLFATFALYHCVKREINKDVALVSAILVTSSFAIFVSAGEIMYETSMMSFFLIGLNLLSRFSLNNEEPKRTAIFASVSLALSILIHPSMLGPVVVVLIVIFIRVFKRKSRNLALLVLVLLIVVSGPGLNTLRNYISGDGLGYTGNIYTISTFSGWGSQDPEKLRVCNDIGVKITSPALISKGWFYDSTPRQICLYKIALENPGQSLEIAVRNGIRWVSPYIGVLKSNGTWYHGLDLRRIVPQYQWWEGNSRVIDTVLCSIWILIHLSLMLFGCYLLLRRRLGFSVRDKYTPYLFILPVIFKWLTSIFTHGDSRHRLGVSPLYITLISISLICLLQKSKGKSEKVVQP